MRLDGDVLPDLPQTVILRQIGLVRTDELPGLAARWLAADLIDTESVRMLAGHDANDPWGIDALLAATISEAGTVIPTDSARRQDVAVDWVTSKWLLDHDTAGAVRTLAYLGQTNLDFDLGVFVGLDDEWQGGWGRTGSDVRAEAQRELQSRVHEAH